MLNLASSFRLRNKLKERISALTNAIEAAPFVKTTGTEENTSPCDGKTIKEAVAEVDALMDLLRELNRKIEMANAANRDTLITLETLKARIAFYESLAHKCRMVKEYEIEYDAKGERIKVDKEPIVDQANITAALAALKKEKDALEEKINAANFNIAVDFNPDTILSRL
jgi:molybdopterin converting factor small subunit